MADVLVSTAQIKSRLLITDATDDALLTELNEQACDFIQELTGRQFVATSAVTYLIDTRPGSLIRVPRGVRTITSLGLATSDQPDDGTGTYTAVVAADIVLRPSAFERKPGWPATEIWIRGSAGRCSLAINGAKIIGDWGFSVVPPVVQAVALDAITAAYTARQAGDSDAIGADGSPVAVWARMFSAGTAQRQTLDRYRAARGLR